MMGRTMENLQPVNISPKILIARRVSQEAQVAKRIERQLKLELLPIKTTQSFDCVSINSRYFPFTCLGALLDG